jgi:hypothetical protein
MILRAVTRQEPLRLRVISEAIVAEIFGLESKDFAWILRSDPADPKGFWRVDQEKPLELRHTTLALAAFRDLKEMGLDTFCSLPDPDGLPGCGWQIPETLTFAVRDGGMIDFGAKDGTTFTVRERLGPGFQPWQLEGATEDSWAECELHATSSARRSSVGRWLRCVANRLETKHPNNSSQLWRVTGSQSFRHRQPEPFR